VRITVSLDTHAVIAQPSPLRVKAASFVPIEIAFTRGTQTVRLPEEAVIEIGFKERGKPDANLLVFHAGFEATAGNLYNAVINCATTQLHTLLGITDGDTANDKITVELSGEIGWTFGGQHFRSQTFPVIAEAPVVSSDTPAPLVPPDYPSPENLLLRADFPFQLTCPTDRSAAQNGAALLALYAEAKNVTPNGLPLGTDNRIALLLPPATYDLGNGSLLLDSPHIDLVGLGTPESVAIVSSASTLIHQAPSTIRNLTLRTRANVVLNSDPNDPAAYFPDNGLEPVLDDVILKADHDGSGAWTMRQGVSYDGTYHKVIAGKEPFGGRGTPPTPARATITVNSAPDDGETLEITRYTGDLFVFEFDSDQWGDYPPIRTVAYERPRGTITLDSIPENGDMVIVDIGWGYVLTFRFSSGGGAPDDEIEVVIVPGDTAATAERLRVAIENNAWFESLQRTGAQVEIVFADMAMDTESSIASESAAISITYDPRGTTVFNPEQIAQEIADVLESYGFGSEVDGNTVTIIQPGGGTDGHTPIGGSYSGLTITDFSGGSDAVVPVCHGTISECAFEGPLLCRFGGRLHNTRISSEGGPTALYVRDGAEIDVAIDTDAPYSVSAHDLDYRAAEVTLRNCRFSAPVHPGVVNILNLANAHGGPIAVGDGGTGRTSFSTGVVVSQSGELSSISGFQDQLLQWDNGQPLFKNLAVKSLTPSERPAHGFQSGAWINTTTLSTSSARLQYRSGVDAGSNDILKLPSGMQNGAQFLIKAANWIWWENNLPTESYSFRIQNADAYELARLEPNELALMTTWSGAGNETPQWDVLLFSPDPYLVKAGRNRNINLKTVAATNLFRVTVNRKWITTGLVIWITNSSANASTTGGVSVQLEDSQSGGIIVPQTTLLYKDYLTGTYARLSVAQPAKVVTGNNYVRFRVTSADTISTLNARVLVEGFYQN